jgi:hypothetical protein
MLQIAQNSSSYISVAGASTLRSSLRATREAMHDRYHKAKIVNRDTMPLLNYAVVSYQEQSERVYSIS